MSPLQDTSIVAISTLAVALACSAPTSSGSPPHAKPSSESGFVHLATEACQLDPQPVAAQGPAWTVVAFDKWLEAVWVLATPALGGEGTLHQYIRVTREPIERVLTAKWTYQPTSGLLEIETGGQDILLRSTLRGHLPQGARSAMGEAKITEDNHSQSEPQPFWVVVFFFVDENDSVLHKMVRLNRCARTALSKIK